MKSKPSPCKTDLPLLSPEYHQAGSQHREFCLHGCSFFPTTNNTFQNQKSVAFHVQTNYAISKNKNFKFQKKTLPIRIKQEKKIRKQSIQNQMLFTCSIYSEQEKQRALRAYLVMFFKTISPSNSNHSALNSFEEIWQKNQKIKPMHQ